jgi:uncharacterized membrane protein YqjE
MSDRVDPVYEHQAHRADPALEPKEPDASLGELFGRFTSNMSELFRKEVALARVETKEEVSKAAKGGGMAAGGGLIAYLCLVFLSLALAALLNEWMHPAWAFLIVAVLHGVIAGILIAVGRQRLKEVNPVPEQTVETLKEDVEWAKAQRS